MNCIVFLIFLVGWAKMTRFAASAFECILSGLQFFGVWISSWFMQSAFKGFQLACVCIPQIHDCAIFLKSSAWPIGFCSRFVIGREKPGEQSEVAQLIQQTLEQERWQREMMEQRYKQYMDDDEEVTCRYSSFVLWNVSKEKKRKAETFVFLWQKIFLLSNLSESSRTKNWSAAIW